MSDQTDKTEAVSYPIPRYPITVRAIPEIIKAVSITQELSGGWTEDVTVTEEEEAREIVAVLVSAFGRDILPAAPESAPVAPTVPPVTPPAATASAKPTTPSKKP